ncbi:hypothetical protein DNTS_013281 [Danionella cerebrum]|uniref:Uncharacterized protein n=1 Tax=Danionella cerebrum TaxID=2873325 RepID=A0A553RQF1_9TELE|nr:hypothetical protein DNTS_013281 [Danionella translucida]
MLRPNKRCSLLSSSASTISFGGSIHLNFIWERNWKYLLQASRMSTHAEQKSLMDPLAFYRLTLAKEEFPHLWISSGTQDSHKSRSILRLKNQFSCDKIEEEEEESYAVEEDKAQHTFLQSLESLQMNTWPSVTCEVLGLHLRLFSSLFANCTHHCILNRTAPPSPLSLSLSLSLSQFRNNIIFLEDQKMKAPLTPLDMSSISLADRQCGAAGESLPSSDKTESSICALSPLQNQARVSWPAMRMFTHSCQNSREFVKGIEYETMMNGCFNVSAKAGVSGIPGSRGALRISSPLCCHSTRIDHKSKYLHQHYLKDKCAKACTMSL